ncbi:hypothetical protein BX661DRAFT_173144 [Kickxella alabastrina]|uniref:uncharacterized protein n=1 Tax=Kickxella alabastrina TaxID=61397 RepID=UPI00221EBF0B|nr:uncharacterized protein BX661DRAFT_173144 [Kickxella alabastrina]KAI7822086.1 hypothetical protein BX661DRAFT_173144 [Kickxella alabastrina]
MDRLLSALLLAASICEFDWGLFMLSSSGRINCICAFLRGCGAGGGGGSGGDTGGNEGRALWENVLADDAELYLSADANSFVNPKVSENPDGDDCCFFKRCCLVLLGAWDAASVWPGASF